MIPKYEYTIWMFTLFIFSLIADVEESSQLCEKYENTTAVTTEIVSPYKSHYGN